MNKEILQVTSIYCSSFSKRNMYCLYLAFNSFPSELREFIKEHNSSFPSIEDLHGCAQAIFRIQDVYHISAERIADGKLSSRILSPELGTVHCLDFGHTYHHWEKYEEAYAWFIEAWKRLSPRDKSSGIRSKDVLQYLIWAEYKVRRLETTFKRPVKRDSLVTMR